jgi:AraC family transcriptional regulator of adaptative response / DNA-3-methyladenine glycosylase II
MTPMPALPEREVAYRAVASRDPRFDGRLFVGVLSTGIYCRPSCPSRTPKPAHCAYFSTSAACVAAGFRACRRCRPDALPGSPDGDVDADLAGRALRLVADGVVDDDGVAGLARRLAVSPRHLHRVLVGQLGASPVQLAQTRRAQVARMLLEQSDWPMSDVAFAAGFRSIRQFNDVMRAHLGGPPSMLRRPGDAASGGRASVAGHLWAR